MKKYWQLILIMLITVGCSQSSKQTHQVERSQPENHEEGEVKLSPEQIKFAGVVVSAASKRMIQASLDVPGVVSSTNRGHAVVTPPVAGRVVSINVALGETVRQGQTLAIIESAELAQAWSSIAEARRSRDLQASHLREFQSEVNLALAKLSSAKTNLTRQRELAKAGAFSQAPLQLAQSELNDAQSDLLSVQKEQASHAELVRRLENLYRDGIISRSELEAARLELQQDQIRLDRANARIINAKATYDREKNIATRGLLNAKELQTAEAEVRASTLEVERARIRVRSAQDALASAERAISNAQATYRSSSGTGGGSVGKANLTAPISGIITHLDVTRGQAVDRTAVLMEVENLASIWVIANVPERDASRVLVGAAIRVKVASFPNKEFRGKVQVVGSRVDSKTRAIPIQCLIESEGQLKPDMFATVNIAHGSTTNSIVVPLTAVVTEDSRSFVFIKVPEGFQKREVTLGTRSGTDIQISKGVNAGEMIAVKGSFVLTSEQKKSELQGHDH